MRFVVFVVDAGYHHSKYWIPIHYDTIETKNLIFYSLTGAYKFTYPVCEILREGDTSVMLNLLVFLRIRCFQDPVLHNKQLHHHHHLLSNRTRHHHHQQQRRGQLRVKTLQASGK